MTKSLVEPLSFNTLRAEPFEQIENFQSWAKACVSLHIVNGNLHQVFQVAHAIMIFETLWSGGTFPSEGWLRDSGVSALYVLKKITSEEDTATLSAVNDELLSILLCIREYFVINECFDPNSAVMTVGKIWKEPEFPPAYYFNQLHTVTVTLT